MPVTPLLESPPPTPELQNLNSLLVQFFPLLRIQIRIRRIRMFLSLPDPGPLVSGMDPDPSIAKQK